MFTQRLSARLSERVEYLALRQAEDKVFGMQKQKVRPARRRRNI